MNWTSRINKIVAQMFPIETGWCLWQKQAAMMARISRSDKIKRIVVKLPESEQDKYLTDIENRINVNSDA